MLLVYFDSLAVQKYYIISSSLILNSSFHVSEQLLAITKEMVLVLGSGMGLNVPVGDDIQY